MRVQTYSLYSAHSYSPLFLFDLELGRLLDSQLVMEKLLVCIIFRSPSLGCVYGICVYVCMRYCVNLPPSTALFHLSLSVSPHVWAVWVNWAALELIALALWAPYTLCELWLAARLRNLDGCAWVKSCWLLLTHWFSIHSHNLSTMKLTLSV